MTAIETPRNRWWAELPLRTAYTTPNTSDESTDMCQECGIARWRHDVVSPDCTKDAWVVSYMVAWNEQPALNKDGSVSDLLIEADGTRVEFGPISAQKPPDLPPHSV